ncbi:hypothetical protein P7G96_00530 [Enterococcus thailandicus]|uniref:hypothetical protein n=1 Tax=Enterococcus thailandicus TaxID=417368 RepID=UPI0028920B20|nr:hypothetical protein [Enterococcus thailandicus]MDT2752934.1 hypothetical protein [Enterococcus thailandicus]MDT2774961.1 hypothetical protein [Enterococcus thailandicus]
MKKVVFVFLAVISLVGLSGCVSETKAEQNRIQDNIEQLTQEKQDLEDAVKYLKDTSSVTRYIVTIQIKQSHMSLDFTEHMKDEVNAVEISIPVDRAFYEKVDKGTVIDDSFRTGSFWMKGSIGSWDIKVIDKEIAE